MRTCSVTWGSCSLYEDGEHHCSVISNHTLHECNCGETE